MTESPATQKPTLPPGPRQTGESSSGPKSQKSMTKAERRELQERQRAAKAANTQNAGKATGAQAPKTASPAAPTSPQMRIKSGRTESPRAALTHGRKNSLLESLSDIGAPNQVRIFSHFALPKGGPSAAGIKGEIHPAILRLGLQFAEFKITGANARCIATLTAFKTVIQDYSTPSQTTLSRHLMTYLSPQISYLVTARPMSTSMGNAIRQLKFQISVLSIDIPEQDAKATLCQQIDRYIDERIFFADEIIARTVYDKIHNGDVVLTFARSSLVERVLLHANEMGKQFSVIVVDSRPMLEGKKLLQVLSSAGIPCTYVLLPALGSVITEVNTVFVGAHSLHSNGAVYSRAGTALVAMMAKQNSVPVVVCCESYKYSEGIQLDSFTRNELAPSGDLFSSFPKTFPRESLALKNETNLHVVNPLYDLTPPTNITAVVTEYGLIPPSAISSIPLVGGRAGAQAL